MVYRLDPSIFACLSINMRILIRKRCESLEDIIHVMIIIVCYVAKFISWYRTGRTFTSLDAGHQDLFWVITNIHCKNGMAATNSPITSCHGNTIFSHPLKGLYDTGHAHMKEVCKCPATCSPICYVLEVGSWQVA